MPDTDYLQCMRYFKGEFLEAADFDLEQNYFQTQLKLLASYCFAPGLTLFPQSTVQTIYSAQPRAKVVAQPPVNDPPNSFYLSLISEAPEPAPQTNNYISINQGLAFDPLGNQIALLETVYVLKETFKDIQGDIAYLTIKYAQHTSTTSPKIIVEQPSFQAHEQANYGQEKLYLATVTLDPTDQSILSIAIDSTLRNYARPYIAPEPGPGASPSAETSLLKKEITALKKRLTKLEKSNNIHSQ